MILAWYAVIQNSYAIRASNWDTLKLSPCHRLYIGWERRGGRLLVGTEEAGPGRGRGWLHRLRLLCLLLHLRRRLFAPGTDLRRWRFFSAPNGYGCSGGGWYRFKWLLFLLISFLLSIQIKFSYVLNFNYGNKERIKWKLKIIQCRKISFRKKELLIRIVALSINKHFYLEETIYY